LLGFLVFNLPAFKHFVNKLFFVSEKEVLSSPVLHSFTDFRVHVFTVRVHVVFRQLGLLFRFFKNFVDEVLVHDDLLNLVACLFMTFDKIDKDVI